jgi:glucose-1-phosphate adenylyltransferase
MDPTRVLALVLAGGNGTRLHPLTAEQAKPAVPFAAGFRIIDFVLSNLVNSGITSIYVLAQYKPRSLIEHIATAWAPSPGGQRRIEVVLPPAEDEAGPFKGTADAVYRNLHLIARHRPGVVAVFAADHVYRMDVRQMVGFHRQRRAAVSIAAVPVPIEAGTQFGIIAAAPDGRIEAFHEKPARPAPIPGDPQRAYASMGNYLFDPGALVALLEAASRRGDTDFGRHIMPRLPVSCRAFAYDFACNQIPGLRPYEEHGYWRDIGSLDAYQAALHDVLDPLPRFSLNNPAWPLRGGGGDARALGQAAA